jgi:hypothetical protein
MLKVCTSYSKKVPTDQQYSSQQFHASVEVELSDALSPEQLQERIHQTFTVVRNTVESEISGEEKVTLPPRITGAHAPAGDKTNGNGKATNAQIKYLTSLATEQDIRLSALNAYCHEQYHVDSIYDLTKKQASELVDGLKRNKVKILA